MAWVVGDVDRIGGVRLSCGPGLAGCWRDQTSLGMSSRDAVMGRGKGCRQGERSEVRASRVLSLSGPDV